MKGKLFIFLPVLLAASAFGQSGVIINNLKHHNNLQIQWRFGEAASLMANNLGIDPIVVLASRETPLYDYPNWVTFETYRDNLPGKRFVVSGTHGSNSSGQGRMVVEVFSHVDPRNEKYNQLVEDYSMNAEYILKGSTIYEVVGADTTWYPSISIHVDGMASLLNTNQLDDKAIVVAGYCNSASTFSAWGTPDTDGPACLMLDGTESVLDAVSNLTEAVEDFGCEPNSWNDWLAGTHNETASQVVSDSNHFWTLMPPSGKDNYTVKGITGCTFQDLIGMGVLNSDGSYSLLYRSHQSTTGFVLRDRSSGAQIGDFDTTQCLPLRKQEVRFSRSGFGLGSGVVLEEYAGDHRVGYLEVEFDGCVERARLPQEIAQDIPDCGVRVLPDASNGMELRNTTGYGLVVYNSAPGGFTGSDIEPMVQHVESAIGRVRVVGIPAPGGVNSSSVTSEYHALIVQNEASNAVTGTDYPTYSPGPLLVVVGASNYGQGGEARIVRPFAYSVGDGLGGSGFGGIYDDWIYSDLLLTDVEGDGRPNGPVTRVIANSGADIVRMISYAEEYQSDPGEQYGESLYVYDDVNDGQIDYETRNYGDDLRELGGVIGGIPLLRYCSDLGEHGITRMNAVRDIVDGGVQALWLLGYRNNPIQWAGCIYASQFDQVVFQNEQSVAIYSLSCNSLSPSYAGTPYYIIGGYSDTPCGLKSAVCIGPMGAGTETMSMRMARNLLEEQVGVTSGTLYAEVVYRSVLAALDSDPAGQQYYNSFFTLGALAENRVPHYVGVEEAQGRLEPSVRVRYVGDAVSVEYTSSYSLQNWVDVYDVRGRRIAEVEAETNGDMRRAFWNEVDCVGRRVASGVYLVRVRGTDGAAKVVVTR